MTNDQNLQVANSENLESEQNFQTGEDSNENITSNNNADTLEDSDIEDDLDDVEDNDVSNGDDEEEEQKQTQLQRPSRAKKRINSLIKKNYMLQAQLEAIQRNQNNAREETKEQYQNESAEDYNAYENITLQKPLRDNYLDDTDYIEALTEWKLSQRELAAKQRDLKKQQQHEEYLYRQKKMSHEKQVEALRNEIPDFDEALEDADYNNVAVNNASVNAILESEHGARIRYYFAKNPSEAKKNLAMSPLNAIKHIGRIESEIENNLKANRSKRMSKAPAPIKSVKTSSSGHISVDLNDPSIPMDVWIRERRKLK